MAFAHMKAARFALILLLCHHPWTSGSSDDGEAPTTPASTPHIPVIDIWPLRSPGPSLEARRAVAARIGAACKEVGFFLVENHGVDTRVIAAAWDATREFFDLPLEDKVGGGPGRESLLMTDDFPYGYLPYGGESLAKGKSDVDRERSSLGEIKASAKAGDMKELFSVGPYLPEAGMPLPRYPSRPVAMAGAWRAYFEAMEELCADLLKGFALALELEDERWFAGKTDRHASSLRALNYPQLDSRAPPAPGQLRASAHTDYGVLTVLRSGGAGLQVKLLDGTWLDVPYEPGKDAFVINLGDLMSRWTNDLWRSTPHRVVNPPLGAGEGPQALAGQNHQDNRRQSLAYFCNLNMDAEVSVIPTCLRADQSQSQPGSRPGSPLPARAKYAPTKAGDHLLAKHLASTKGVLDDSWMQGLLEEEKGAVGAPVSGLVGGTARIEL